MYCCSNKVSKCRGCKKEQKARISAAEKIVKEKDKWKSDAFITPTSGSLKAAGYITIEWKSAKNMGKVEGYKLYIDNEKVAETDSKTTSFEYYTRRYNPMKYMWKLICSMDQLFILIFTLSL